MLTEKLCECGCGEGVTNRFASGHNKKGHHNPKWHGGTTTGRYIGKLMPWHPRSNSYGYVLEHIVIAERALGRYLPQQAEVHHINEKKRDNRNSNLVICEDRSYHMLLHQRKRAFLECGNASARKCWICKRWGVDVHCSSKGKGGYHKACQAKYDKERYVNG